MERAISPRKKLKSPGIDATANLNIKTSVTCTNVPEGLFDAAAAKKHFSKFGRVQRIRLFPKKQMCIIEYDQPISAERAVLNAGAYDGFMFDVGRTKARVRRRSKKDDDPDWVPDSDVEEELSAMSGGPAYRPNRQRPMEQESEPMKLKPVRKIVKQSPIRSKPPIREKKPINAQPTSGRESPVPMTTPQTSLSNAEAAAELHQLRSRVSLTPDEQWRTLDARDRILRSWGGAGSRVKVGGATIGTCPDMCPEKELLHRQAEHQVMTLETQPDSDGQLEPWRAVKQYSRSSADQEIPMCYELRPAPVLMHTCLYLLHEIADTTRQVTLADWFHFMWDRFRGIRKDITQQALCCAESIRLVEICARFHAHCSARLADLEHTQFDQKLNTDNLTKCLQTLKHMYADVGPEMKPKEAEFRGYIALLNLGDANFWWEIKQLPLEIQKSQAITFAMQIFNALDNNNYVRFFRLIRDKATYLQACVLLRYFNDVRARALARIVKAYAPRGGSRYPAEELMNSLAFESVESMRSFINHYGLRFGKDESELIVILDRNQFIEDSDPYPLSRSIKLIESKRQSTVGEVIAGGLLPNYDEGHNIYSSFNKDGKLKEAALIAEEQGYNTFNDSNKNVKALKAEIQRLAQGGRVYAITERVEPKQNLFVKPETRSPGKSRATFSIPKTESSESKLFSFNPAIPVAPTEIIHNSPEKVFGGDAKNIFSFSKPQDTSGGKDPGNLFKPTPGSLFGSKIVTDNNLFGRVNNENKDPFPTHNSNKRPDDTNVFKSAVSGKGVFVQTGTDTKSDEPNKNLFGNIANKNIFAIKEDTKTTSQNVFGNKNVFALAKEPSNNSEIATKSEPTTNIFAAAATQNVTKTPPNLFGGIFVSKPNAIPTNLFKKPESGENPPKSFFALNGDGSNKLSPGSLFKSAVNVEGKGYTIFSSKNKAPSVADNIFNSVNTPQNNIYEFNENGEDEAEKQLQQQRLNDQRIMEETEKQIQEKIRREEEERKRLEKLREEEQRKQEEQRRLEEQKRLEELKRLEDKRRREEERKQEELRKKLEEERKAELKRLAEEEERKFKKRVDRESEELIETLVDEVRDETVTEILKEETEKLKNLVAYANKVADEICIDLCDDISYSEMKAEKFLTEKLMKKWFFVWRKQLSKNMKRRCLLEDTPVWLPQKTPTEEASYLRRVVESAALKNMNAIHRGYKFNGELRQLPSAERYNIMEIIKSPLLKRMKQINYPYDKCFFWKVTLVSPGEMKWLCRKVGLEKWLLEAFSDKKKHDTSESLIHVQKQSWNHLMDFGISVSLTNKNNKSTCGEAMEGSNGVLIYATENDHNLIQTIEETLKNKYPYQLIPVAIIMPKTEDLSMTNSVEQTLTNFMNKNIISSFKIILLDPKNVFDSLNGATKSALKWLAKKYPQCPPLEIDYLKSICQRYLGNEIWYRLKSERDGRMNTILKDLHKLVKCYNAAVDKLTEAITNEDLFNYSPFPLEFKEYLDHSTPYPKPFEFIPTNARNSNNTSAIKDMMKKLKLPDPKSGFHPMSVITMQDQIRKYCNQIGWFENPEEVVCKVVAVLPNEFSDVTMSCEQFHQYFEHYDLLDFLNVMVYEKINQLHNFDNRFAIYERSVLENYRNSHWLYEIEAMSKMKHKALDSEDCLDFVIGAKRRKIELDSMEYLMLEDKDCTMVEENIKANNESISRYSNCEEAVKQLEKQIDDERMKSMELENLLKSALCNV